MPTREFPASAVGGDRGLGGQTGRPMRLGGVGLGCFWKGVAHWAGPPFMLHCG